MTYQIRRSNARKFFDHDWLKTYHTFSFGSYYDPNFMGFRDLRVINEDRVAPGGGFPPHAHKNMEIISIVLEGELAHQDSMKNKSIIPANSVQIMCAGAGVTHSEYNPSDADTAHFLQIWILPDEEGITPGYQESQLPIAPNKWVLIGSKTGRDHSLIIHQDIELAAISLDQNAQTEKKIPPTRYGWLQVLEGEISVNQDKCQRGDGLAIEPDTNLSIKAEKPSRLLFFDLK